MKKIEENTKLEIVRKANSLIHSKHGLGEIASKLITIVIASIEKGDDSRQRYQINLFEVADLMKMKSGARYKQLKNASKELRGKTILIEKKELDKDKEDKHFLEMNWISLMEYFPKEGMLELQLSDKLIELVTELKEGNYLNYQLENILRLKSSYVIRLYEILKNEYNKVVNYRKKTMTVEYRMDLDYMREIFEIPKSYLYKDIRERILDKAVKEFKEKTDIEITYQARKQGRAVKYIDFLIYKNDGIKDKNDFIKYAREHKTEDILLIIEEGIEEVKINKKGYLYNRITSKDYPARTAKVLWDKIYEIYIKEVI